MNSFRATLLALAVATAATGCNAGRDATDDTGTTIEKNVETNMQSAMEKARHKLEIENISLDAKGQPDAEITPQGDLLIGGRPVPVTPEQRALLLDYREKVSQVAKAGMDVGVQGARLATTAMKEALRGVFNDTGDKVEERVQAQAEPIRKAALELCDRLPELLASQQQLAIALPAFAPYAEMDQTDIDDCRRDAAEDAPPAPPSAPAAPVAPSAQPDAAAAGVTAAG